MPESKSKEKFVRYIGTAGVREINKAAWANVDVKNQEQAVWSVRNGWKLPQQDFTDAALDYFRTDEGFVVDE